MCTIQDLPHVLASKKVINNNWKSILSNAKDQVLWLSDIDMIDSYLPPRAVILSNNVPGSEKQKNQ